MRSLREAKRHVDICNKALAKCHMDFASGLDWSAPMLYQAPKLMFPLFLEHKPQTMFFTAGASMLVNQMMGPHSQFAKDSFDSLTQQLLHGDVPPAIRARIDARNPSDN